MKDISRQTCFGPTTQAINRKMATGFNFGNTFDFKSKPAEFTRIKPLVNLYYSEGMRHIRIPVTWMDTMPAPRVFDACGFTAYGTEPRARKVDGVY